MWVTRLERQRVQLPRDQGRWTEFSWRQNTFLKTNEGKRGKRRVVDTNGDMGKKLARKGFALQGIEMNNNCPYFV